MNNNNTHTRTLIVHHMQRTGGMFYKSNPVAKVEIPLGTVEHACEQPALSFAYKCTQNIGGSWSRDDIADNPDSRPECTRIGDLEVHNGEVYGLRSSMVGDVIELIDVIYGETKRFFYQVAGVGFNVVTPESLHAAYYRFTPYNDDDGQSPWEYLIASLEK